MKFQFHTLPAATTHSDEPPFYKPEPLHLVPPEHPHTTYHRWKRVLDGIDGYKTFAARLDEEGFEVYAPPDCMTPAQLHEHWITLHPEGWQDYEAGDSPFNHEPMSRALWDGNTFAMTATYGTYESRWLKTFIRIDEPLPDGGDVDWDGNGGVLVVGVNYPRPFYPVDSYAWFQAQLFNWCVRVAYSITMAKQLIQFCRFGSFGGRPRS